MDTSTPLKKSNRSPELFTPNAPKSSCYVNREANRVNAIELEPSDLCAKWADASTCDEVFPLPVSPICCARNVTADFADVPYLDFSNLKWSCSLHTSVAEDEAEADNAHRTDEVVETETEFADLIRSPAPHHYCAVAVAETKTKAEAAENDSDDDGTGLDDGRCTTSNPPRSPIFATGGNQSRCRSRGARRKKMTESLLNEREREREDATELGALKLGNLQWQTSCESTNATSKTSRYTFDSAREISKRFVYPLTGVCIRKPQRSLNVDQLTSCALSLETTRDDTRSSLISGSSSNIQSSSSSSSDRASAMVAFSRLLNNDEDEKIDGRNPPAPRDDIKQHPRSSVIGALARIIFARKHNDDDTVRARFVALADRLRYANANAYENENESAKGAAYRLRAGVARLLYSAYYFAARVNLACYATDQFYKRAFIRQFTGDVSNSFEVDVRFDYAANLFQRIVDDIYTLDRTMAIPVASLYVTRSKALRWRWRCIEPIDVHADGGNDGDRLRGTLVRIRESADEMTTTGTGAGAGTTARHHLRLESSCGTRISTAYALSKNRDAGDVESACKKRKTGDPQPLDFKTCSGRFVNVGDESLRRISERLFPDTLTEDECNVGDGGGAERKMEAATAILGFKTSSGRTINVDDNSLRMSARLFSDLSTETEYNVSADDADGGKVKKAMAASASGFKTGSGKTINVDDGSLRKSARLFCDISTEEECSSGFGTSGTGGGDGKVEIAVSGFKTSSGKTISLAGSSLRMSAHLFSDMMSEAQTSTSTNPSLTTGASDAVTVANVASVTKVAEDAKNAKNAKFASAFRTGAGKVVNVKVESLQRYDSLLADCANQSETKAEETKMENERSERELCSQRNQSFDLGREITESTSAFLYDISHEQSWCSFFAPNESAASADADANPNPNPNRSSNENARSPPPPVDCLYESDADASNCQMKVAGSRSCSPVFDSKYGSSKRRCSTGRSNGRRSLDITYVRKTEAVADRIRAESETLKTNFSCKAFKRKSNSANDSSALVTAKKCRNDASAWQPQTPPPPSHRAERLAFSSSASRTAVVARQRNYISNKPKQNCRPTRGYLSTLIRGDGDCDGDDYRGRISLVGLARYEKPKLYTYDEYIKFGLFPVVIRVNSQNARYFAFTSQFFSGQQLKSDATGATLFGDAVPIIFNEQNQVTLEEVISGFLASPGVDPKLVSREWLANHYRWIVWKLAATERFFPNSLGGRYLTLDNVLFQLKFKYEQEVDRSVRSALKRIVEGDDTPTRPVILCVASISKEAHLSNANANTNTKTTPNANAYKMELTDGWYSIFAQTDHQMDELIARKKVLVGTKLIIVGAELVGWGEPCDPLQASENVRFKFSANSSRRVRWDARLGFYNGGAGPINRIRTILPKGGFIPQLTAVVARVYPWLFLEKYDNAAATAAAAADVSATATATTTATTTTNASWSRIHNEKVEMKKAAAFERDRQNFIESILSQVTNQVLNENAKNAKTDADTFADNDRLRQVIQQRVQSRLPAKFSKNRHVSRLLKLRLVDAQDVKYESSAILTIWNPCDDVADFFTEGRLYRFFNVNANGIRNGELQLSSTRSSKYDRCYTGPGANTSTSTSASSTGGEGNGDSACWFDRRVRSVDDFNKRCEEDEKCPFDEVDVTGVVIRIEPESESPSDGCGYEQNCRMYLADLQRNFLALSFRIDTKNFDFGDSMANGKIVAGLNLQWKNGRICWKIPVLYVSEMSSFVQSTNIASLRQSIDQIRRHFQSHKLETFVAECEEKLKDIVNSNANVAAATTSAVQGSTVITDSVHQATSAAAKATAAAAAAEPSTESDLCNKTTLVVGNQTTFKNSDMRSKFERLQNYGRPPALSPIVLSSHSKIKAKLPLPISRRSFKS